MLISAGTFAQEMLSVQVKAFDQQLKVLGNIELSINGNEYFGIGARGVVIAEIPQKDLPPKSVAIKNEELEAESWNYSKGVLEIIVRKKSYRIVTVTVLQQNGRAVPGADFTFHGSKVFRGSTGEAGTVEMPLPVNEKILNQHQFRFSSFTVQRMDVKGDGFLLYVVPVSSRQAPVAKKEVQSDPSSRFNNFDLKELDSIRSLTVFYAVFKNSKMGDLGEEEKRRIDDKFRQLITQLEDSLSRPGHSFLGNISDSSFVGEDVRNLLAQAEAEKQTLDFLRDSFDEKINVLNEKLTDGAGRMDEATRTKLLGDIGRLEAILEQNEQKFYKNQNDYRSLLNSLKENFFDIEDLENKLSLSEAQRLEDKEEFRKKSFTIFLVALCFALLTVLLVYFSNRLKNQKRQLETANGEIRRMNENLESLVSERTVLLENAHREMDIFLYKASHDLRGPICSIIGLCNIASRTMDPASLEIVQKTYNTASAMDRMLKKLKVISEINHPSNYSLVMLDEQIRSVRNEYRMFMRDNNVGMKIECGAAISFHSYPNLVEVIIMNLVENALYFSTVKNSFRPEILIKAVHNKTSVCLTIRDNGIGIDEAIRERIWDMFFIGSEHSHGNGLGLYIVRKSVHALGGTIAIDSVAGEFTEVTVVIPVVDTLTISPRKEQPLLATHDF